jgi:hypothetical protein
VGCIPLGYFGLSMCFKLPKYHPYRKASLIDQHRAKSHVVVDAQFISSYPTQLASCFQMTTLSDCLTMTF